MQTGQSVTDSQGTAWTVGQELGRGSFARSFVARSATGREAVLKVALEPGDLFGDEADALASACNKILSEQAALMREHGRPWLPELLGELTTPGGSAALLTPRLPATLATRLRGPTPLASLLASLAATAQAAEASPHGNLRPENVLLAADGRVFLCDPLTPTWVAQGPRLAARLGERPSPRPPQARGEPTSACDAYALCLALYQAAMAAPAPAEARGSEPARGLRDGQDLPRPPREGLDKSALARIKDRVLARLDQESANPRFAPRVADRLCALLNRGLSEQAAPSPPYRFGTVTELRARLQELVDLVDPRVLGAGRVLLATTAREGVFAEGEHASFSTTVTCTDGVSHEDLAAGLLVRDLDADGDDRVPVPDAQFSVKPHPSGRLRFDFTLPDLRPGRYTVRIAFAVKDSSHPPTTTDGHFELRPPPGYVPPADDPPPASSALPFPSAGALGGRPSLNLDSPRFDPATAASDPDLDHELDRFPTPIAPSDPGSSPGSSPDDPPPLLRSGPVERATNPGPSLQPSPVAPVTPRPTASASSRQPPGLGDLNPLPSIAPSAPDLHAEAPSQPDADPTAEAPRPPPPAPPEPASSRPSRARGWAPGGTWEELPGPDLGPDALDLGLDQPLADLPPIDDTAPSGLPAPLQRVLDQLRDNPWITMAGLVAGIILMLVAFGVLFQTCTT